MPKLTHEYEIEIMRAIRDCLAADPYISGKKLKETLDKRFNHNFAWAYLQRLQRKVKGQVAVRLDHEKVEKRLTELRELFRLGRERLLAEMLGQKLSAAQKAYIWSKIAVSEKMLVDIDLELGMYNRTLPSDSIDAIRYREIPTDIRAGMIEAAKGWRLPTVLVRKIEAVKVENVETPNPEPKEATASPLAPTTAQQHGQPDPEF